jgi:hypothetical protein
LLRRHRAECTDPKIAEYGGRIANTAGDSILIEFPSVVEALRCTMEIQHPLHDFNYRWVLGQSHFYLASYREAAAAFEDVIQRNPVSVAGHLMLAATYALLGRIDDAQWSAGEILTLQPGFTLREARAHTVPEPARPGSLYRRAGEGRIAAMNEGAMP